MKGKRMRSFAAAAAALSLGLAAAMVPGMVTGPETAAAADLSQWRMVWNDEFNGANGSAPDGSKWNLIHAGGGFGNNELQYYTNRRDNSYLENGNLVIKAQKEEFGGHAYTSAKLTSQNKGDWKYGRFEIRAKLPYGRSVWPAFWMMPTDSVYGIWPKSGEIDIMENRGDQMNKVSGTIHYGNDWPNNLWSGADYLLPEGQSFADDYHTFAVEWEEREIRWYVDGQLYSTKRDWFTPGAAFPAPFDQRFYMQLNLAIGGPGTPFTGWQNPDDSVLPQRMYIDYVRVYERIGKDTGGEHVTADYTAGVSKLSSSQANIYFRPVTAARYVDVHYTVNNGIQQNLRMTNRNGVWETMVSGLKAGDTIRYWFTYEKNGPQYDSPPYTYRQS
ncbi:glycoside hydrolase family 16 protein [Paenibacillus tarimensis]|uniref:glycoside hydrolase family 16 protein n=1 Tax=Paenibacillus tarimensis TaxID=416012 RepID=UPI001F2BB0C2|nr:glycoside hydrolase family 16 protein [Paenibacillus tarimensis]MCF2945391.1 glycoside hydrolase family 16 protein [Paenibacillus tarimensis]